MAYEININDQITEKEEYVRYGGDVNDAPDNIRSENPGLFDHYSTKAYLFREVFFCKNNMIVMLVFCSD